LNFEERVSLFRGSDISDYRLQPLKDPKVLDYLSKYKRVLERHSLLKSVFGA